MATRRFKSPIETNLILVNPKGHVLLTYRENTGFADHMWCLPSGKVESFESPKQAIIREAKEEINVDVNPEFSSVISVKEPNIEAPGKLWQSLAFFFKCNSWEGEILNNEPEKHGRVEFFPLDDLPHDMIAVCIKGLENYVQQIPFSEFHTE